ncbi:PREDICTED: uncharacterized transmembrane protein DDB_G0285607-like [Nelumbo nucifera]|uniref:Uncharacterized transmembrane protein DDB_G0285607-like n=1 Tax=Nelumbo nucifera TaxID=4432 RepID=A0A1U8A407_NELNU|nr:PREDICTED: uncharacterized transmembrane protein DDB_G0285607-like [Nelumbo nucifera]
MEDRKEKNAAWLSVPQFGDWDQKGDLPDYSMDFTKIREMRKQNKRDISRASLGNEEELTNGHNNKNSSNNNNNINNNQVHHHNHVNDDQHPHNHSPTTRRSFLSYFNCCVKA